MRNIIDRIRSAPTRRASKFRNRYSKRVESATPDFLEGRAIGSGTMTGAVGAGILTILEETVGVPFGASSDIVSVDPVDGGAIYTVNVNAPTQNMAQARAFIDSTTGFVSYLTDRFEIENAEVLNTRMARDTYQVEVLVED